MCLNGNILSINISGMKISGGAGYDELKQRTSMKIERLLLSESQENIGSNHRLFPLFFIAINPVDIDDFRDGNFLQKIVAILLIPVKLLLCFTIPLVDHGAEKHGWCKLLNIIHLFTVPAMTVFATDSKYHLSTILIINEILTLFHSDRSKIWRATNLGSGFSYFICYCSHCIFHFRYIKTTCLLRCKIYSIVEPELKLIKFTISNLFIDIRNCHFCSINSYHFNYRR